MEKLIRTKVERFDVKDSIDLSQIEECRDNGTLEQYIIPVDKMLDKYSKCIVAENAEKLVYNGNIFTTRNTLLKMNNEDGQTVRVYTHDGKFIGLYMFEEKKQIYKPVKMFL
jgi:tRNA pseudouridine55 synthase